MQKDEWLESMRAAFASFDKDGSGSISVEELREVLVENLGQQVSDDELDRLVKLADANGDGEIDFDEFVKLLQDVELRSAAEKRWTKVRAVAHIVGKLRVSSKDVPSPPK